MDLQVFGPCLITLEAKGIRRGDNLVRQAGFAEDSLLYSISLEGARLVSKPNIDNTNKICLLSGLLPIFSNAYKNLVTFIKSNVTHR